MKLQHIAITLISALTLGACGGGGGGGDTAAIEYTGARTAIVITQANAEEIAEGALSTTTSGVSPGTILGVVTEDEASTNSRAYSILIGQALANAVLQMEITSDAFLPGVTVTESDQIDCDNGTTASYTITADDVTGEFSGSMRFNNCVSLDTIISGSMSFRGTIDLDSLEFFQFSMSFTSLTTDDGIESITISGNINLDFSGSTLAMLMDFVARDNTTGEVFMLEDFSVDVTDLVTEAIITFSGKFYEPTYGFGVVTTTQPLRIHNTDNWPYFGQFTIDGDNSSLRVTAINNAQYTLEVDEDGDNIYEHTNTVNW